ncbi:MAG: nickel-responsive transcriptional regulator NikR [Burkholderiales bacterium]|jgi:CopG family nickel-responsive transcriptional regulator|nr:nickel-responsive transcriptional regulator NikR [Burkholderiales bacterium]
MERITISMSDELAQDFDTLIKARGYTNRSEAVRDLLRERLAAEKLAHHAAPFCVAALSYVFDHHARDLAERLTTIQHAHHDLVLSSMHVHLDHVDCLETLMLRGPTVDVVALADALRAEPGVRHGHLNIVPVDVGDMHTHPHPHSHAHPLMPR